MAKAKKNTAATTEATAQKAIPASIAAPSTPLPASPTAKSTPAATTKPVKTSKGVGGKVVAAVSKPAPPAPGVQQIDTSLAAATAARMIGAKVTPPAAGEIRVQSSTFRQLKESMSKPVSSGLNSILNNTAGPASKQSGLPFSGESSKQAGRNQTFGADVNRFNVPRRTGG